MPSKSIKGYAFEWFVRRILNGCGFASVVPDNRLVFKNGRNVMVHGLGQPHNADVLVTPPVQIPFYFPSRLIVECKCMHTELGIEHGRNVFGLREDINSFDVVTPSVLRDRANYRRRTPATYPFERYYYQVALASTSGFKVTVQEFAAVHRIPLLQFGSGIVSSAVGLIHELDHISMSQFDREMLLDAFTSGGSITCRTGNCTPEVFEWAQVFSRECGAIARRMDIGLLDNGAILFLFKPDCPDRDRSAYAGEYALRWSAGQRCWTLYENGAERYRFELPGQLMRIWANTGRGGGEDAALYQGEEAMKDITVYTRSENGKVGIRVLTVPSSLIKRALCDCR